MEERVAMDENLLSLYGVTTRPIAAAVARAAEAATAAGEAATAAATRPKPVVVAIKPKTAPVQKESEAKTPAMEAREQQSEYFLDTEKGTQEKEQPYSAAALVAALSAVAGKGSSTTSIVPKRDVLTSPSATGSPGPFLKCSSLQESIETAAGMRGRANPKDRITAMARNQPAQALTELRKQIGTLNSAELMHCLQAYIVPGLTIGPMAKLNAVRELAALPKKPSHAEIDAVCAGIVAACSAAK